MLREDTQTLSFRGRRSRNKVSVGEPAEGSFTRYPNSLLWEVTVAFGRHGTRPSSHFNLDGFYLMTSSDECVSSNYDEGRSEVRYAVRLADFREPLDFRTHPAPPDLRRQIRVSAFFQTPP